MPLKAGIEKAQSFGSKIIWCHNQWGLEDIPSWVMGRLHANNIFDGGTHGHRIERLGRKFQRRVSLRHRLVGIGIFQR